MTREEALPILLTPGLFDSLPDGPFKRELRAHALGVAPESSFVPGHCGACKVARCPAETSDTCPLKAATTAAPVAAGWPEEAPVIALCEQHGYGAVMQAAARAWKRKDPVGALTVGSCACLIEKDAADLARLRADLERATVDLREMIEERDEAIERAQLAGRSDLVAEADRQRMAKKRNARIAAAALMDAATAIAERDAAIQRAERAEARIREACDVAAAARMLDYLRDVARASNGEPTHVDQAFAVLAPLLGAK